jgi:hypothetical protein
MVIVTMRVIKLLRRQFSRLSCRERLKKHTLRYHMNGNNYHSFLLSIFSSQRSRIWLDAGASFRTIFDGNFIKT